MAQHAAYVEDVLLVDRCLDGERMAATELFRRQQRRVHATLYRVLGHNRDMDDLMQETFLQVFRSLGSYRGEARLSTWIDRIAVRVAYRHIASSRKSPIIGLEVVPEPAPDPINGAAVDRQAMAREGVRRLYRALEEQSPAARVAFALHAIDGRPVAEVAALVGASVTTTKVRIWRARKALRRAAAADPLLRDFLDESAEVSP